MLSACDQRANDGGKWSTLDARGVAPHEALLPFAVFPVTDEQRFARVRGFRDVAFSGALRSAERCRGIVARLLHQQQFILVLYKPQVDRLNFQHFANLGGDERLKLVHFKRRTEYFLKIVELSEPRHRFEQGIALIFIKHGADQSRPSVLDKIDQNLKVR